MITTKKQLRDKLLRWKGRYSDIRIDKNGDIVAVLTLGNIYKNKVIQRPCGCVRWNIQKE